MKEKNPELNPCPVCKNKARWASERRRLATDYFSYFIRCSCCGIKGQCYPDYNIEVTKKFAAEWWNYNTKLITRKKKKLSKRQRLSAWNRRTK